MSKTKKVETPIEEATIENLNENINVDEQPAPNTTTYEVIISTTDKFVNDVINALGEFSYAETNQILSAIQNNRNMPISNINEILNRIASFPWKAVNGVMTIVSTKQDEYFIVNNPAANN
jgi:hypothetical protein